MGRYCEVLPVLQYCHWQPDCFGFACVNWKERTEWFLRCFGSSLSFSLSWAFLKTRRWVAKSSTSLVVKYGCQSTSLDLRNRKIERLMNHGLNGLHFNTMFTRENVSEHLNAVFGLWSGVASSLEKPQRHSQSSDFKTDLGRTCVSPGGELNEGVLDRLSDLQEERFIVTQCVIPILDIVPQSKLDNLMNDRRRWSRWVFPIFFCSKLFNFFFFNFSFPFYIFLNRIFSILIFLDFILMVK